MTICDIILHHAIEILIEKKIFLKEIGIDYKINPDAVTNILSVLKLH